MGDQKKKPDDKDIIKLALITATLSLLEKIIDLVIKLLEILGGS